MPHCENCGNWVSDDYVRVNSPQGRDTVRACPAEECAMTRGDDGRPRAVRQTGKHRGTVLNEDLPEVSE